MAVFLTRYDQGSEMDQGGCASSYSFIESGVVMDIRCAGLLDLRRRPMQHGVSVRLLVPRAHQVLW